MGWAYGFTFAGALLAFCLGTIVWTAVSSHRPEHTPTAHVETSERFRPTR